MADGPIGSIRGQRPSAADREPTGVEAVKQKLLLVENDEAGAGVVMAALVDNPEPPFAVDWVRNYATGIARLAAVGRPRGADGIAAVLVDLRLPDAGFDEAFDGLFAAAPHIPILVLCAAADAELARGTIQRGAQDFLLKGRLDSYLLPKTLAAIIDRASIAEALFDEKERAEVTLNSIGDAVISTDIDGLIAYMNATAQRLTGWPLEDALGQPLEQVFRIIDSNSRIALPNPMQLAISARATVGLPPSCLLIGRDGDERGIEDSSAPIHDRRGRVTGAVMVFHDVTMSRALAQKLSHLAQHDSLTDLPNRDLLNDRLQQAVAMAQRHNEVLALLYLDLDRFKRINDSMGHLIGDRLLQTVALRLSGCVRHSDTVSRLGGDEFVILLSTVARAEDAAVCADKILQAVRLPCDFDNHEVNVTASVGIAMYPEDGLDPVGLLQNADSAMYEAKHRGRDNYQFYQLTQNASAAERQALESALRHAIGRDELELLYQPVVDLGTGGTTGVESLLRWRHPQLGLLVPERFMSIAEESGLIVPIGQWVLRTACRQAAAWRKACLPPIRLAVNMSAMELRSRNYVAEVSAILDETDFEAANLELELTETFLMQDFKSTAVVLGALKDLGVHLALDDFGTGYSSLSYMRRFPIDALKVDRSFVRDLSTDEDDASVVRAVINMGRSLHMRVVAEGVETAAQIDFLQAHGCQEAQGYFFSPPVTAPACAESLRRGGVGRWSGNAGTPAGLRPL